MPEGRWKNGRKKEKLCEEKFGVLVDSRVGVVVQLRVARIFGRRYLPRRCGGTRGVRWMRRSAAVKM